MLPGSVPRARFDRVLCHCCLLLYFHKFIISVLYNQPPIRGEERWPAIAPPPARHPAAAAPRVASAIEGNKATELRPERDARLAKTCDAGMRSDNLFVSVRLCAHASDAEYQDGQS